MDVDELSVRNAAERVIRMYREGKRVGRTRPFHQYAALVADASKIPMGEIMAMCGKLRKGKSRGGVAAGVTTQRISEYENRVRFDL